jgi:hypothetical protein
VFAHGVLAAKNLVVLAEPHTTVYSPPNLSLSLSHRRGSASAAEPPACSSSSLSLLDAAAAALLLLAPERLRFGT